MNSLSLVQLTAEASGVQAAARGAPDAQRPRPVGCAAIFGQGPAGWGWLANSRTMVWLLCAGQAWCSTSHHQFTPFLNYFSA